MQLKIDKNWNERIDKILAKRFSEVTRSKLQELIKKGYIKVNGSTVKPSYKLKCGDTVDIQQPHIEQIPTKSNIPLNIIYEDEFLIAVNKDYGVVSHPAGKYKEGTLLQGIYHYLDKKGELQKLVTPLFKPTLIHRLDKDTSGIILVAKTLDVYHNIQKQFIRRTVYKEYWCIVEGFVKFDSDLIKKKISKSKVQFGKMSISANGKEAETIYKVIKRFRNFSLVSAIPKTGRTHQIRVHLASIGHPIICDAVYGKRKMLYKWQIENYKLHLQEKIENLEQKIEQEKKDIPIISRQALHARKIQFTHPTTGQILTLEAKLPDDFTNTIQCLEQYQII